MPPYTITPQDLVFHILNVGRGDSIVVELPPDGAGARKLCVVDCYRGRKTLDYVTKLNGMRPFASVLFACATHPHSDHMNGLADVLRDPLTRPELFWESGFRHSTVGYGQLLAMIGTLNIPMVRVSSGMERYHGPIRITVLAPAVSLRNRFATHGVDMNNASVVLRFEYCGDDAVTVQSTRYSADEDPDLVRRIIGRKVAILSGDAEFDSWSCVAQEYPCIVSESGLRPALPASIVNLLSCGFLKVSHHGSMHSGPLDVLERMAPKLAVISTRQEQSTKTVNEPGGTSHQLTRSMFPHGTTAGALEEVGATVLTTDGCCEKAPLNAPGSVVVALTPAGKMYYEKLGDTTSGLASPPSVCDYAI